ncbi:helix-turn-helix transcriptional regulator [Paenibacillus endoradicis]|uniref:helix-turn-helix transcriptional regulator n=1 Tax=Paenibacillus endoradicis TaxID=2972487 RepID=UPI00215977CE|nr:helix-turn-helix transcriptional regulator [Paenibacillus endoradicis]MCR8656787.1 helix-turn-helix transcriptional regulator [Paenibacillus endoradicis]
MNRDEAYSFLDRVAKGLAETFGKQCETLIHDMNVKGNPILSIYNNEVTGREVGSIVDVLGSTKDMNEVLKEVDFINHLAITPDGRQIKSSTFHMIGEDYKFALGINFDFSELVQANRLLLNLMNVGGDLQSAISQAGEGMVSTLFDECLAVIGKPVEDMNKRDRMKLIKLLKQKNVFDMHKSVPFVSEKLKVSRYTIYNYLNEIEEE